MKINLAEIGVHLIGVHLDTCGTGGLSDETVARIVDSIQTLDVTAEDFRTAVRCYGAHIETPEECEQIRLGVIGFAAERFVDDELDRMVRDGEIDKRYRHGSSISRTSIYAF